MLRMEKTQSTRAAYQEQNIQSQNYSTSSKDSKCNSKDFRLHKQKEDASDTSHWHMELQASAFKVVALKETHIQGKQS